MHYSTLHYMVVPYISFHFLSYISVLYVHTRIICTICIYMHLYASICIQYLSLLLAKTFSVHHWIGYLMAGPFFLGSFWPPFILRIHHRTMCIHMPHIFTSHLGHSPELGPRSNLDSCQPLENLRPFGLPENMVPRNPLVGHQFPHSMAGHLEGMLYSQRDIP